MIEDSFCRRLNYLLLLSLNDGTRLFAEDTRPLEEGLVPSLNTLTRFGATADSQYFPADPTCGIRGEIDASRADVLRRAQTS